MEIRSSAFKHGLSREDIEHAVRFAVRHARADEMTMVIGPARDGTLFEVGVIDLDGDEFEPAAIHAMRLRRGYQRRM